MEAIRPLAVEELLLTLTLLCLRCGDGLEVDSFDDRLAVEGCPETWLLRRLAGGVGILAYLRDDGIRVV